jgi:hypothetical protein
MIEWFLLIGHSIAIVVALAFNVHYRKQLVSIYKENKCRNPYFLDHYKAFVPAAILTVLQSAAYIASRMVSIVLGSGFTSVAWVFDAVYIVLIGSLFLFGLRLVFTAYKIRLKVFEE